MFCKKCGSEIGDAKFCPNCGEVVNDVEPNPNAFTTNSTPYKTVNKIVYALLAIFSGCLGIHRFYAGKTGSGILYLILTLLFIGLFFLPIVGLIEGIVALTRPSDANGNIPVNPNTFFV